EGADQLKAYLKTRNAHPDFIALAAQQGIEALLNDPQALAKVQQIETLLDRFGAVRGGHHSPFAYLMGADGRFVGMPLNTQDGPEALVQAIAKTLGLKTAFAATPSP